jgi:hypothetical protein
MVTSVTKGGTQKLSKTIEIFEAYGHDHLLERSCLMSTFQGSSQGILACRAGTRVPPAGTHENKKIFIIFYFIFIMFYACISLQNSFMHVSLFKTCRNA